MKTTKTQAPMRTTTFDELSITAPLTDNQLLQMTGGSFTKWLKHHLGEKTRRHNLNQNTNPQITD